MREGQQIDDAVDDPGRRHRRVRRFARLDDRQDKGASGPELRSPRPRLDPSHESCVVEGGVEDDVAIATDVAVVAVDGTKSHRREVELPLQANAFD
jgi:hypothetical protein